MEEINCTNSVELRGSMFELPSYSHQIRYERFFTFPLEVARLSKTVDVLNIIARENLLDIGPCTPGTRLHILGELRSFNNKSGTGPKLIITVFAKQICMDTSGEELNTVSLRGTICKPPSYRTTPMGREICDLMLAVNRKYGRSDYLPCITWGLKAKEAAHWHVGDTVTLTGRAQSRNYIKLIENTAVEKTAFEVSVTDIARCSL